MSTIVAATRAFIRQLPKVAKQGGLPGVKGLVADTYTPAFIALTRSSAGTIQADALRAALGTRVLKDKNLRAALANFLEYLPKAAGTDPIRSIQGLAADAFAPVLAKPANAEVVARAAENFRDLAGGLVKRVVGSKATPI